MVASPTRRQLLGGLGGTLIAGGIGSQQPVESLHLPTPSPGTWPSGEYDTSNTRSNPHTSLSSQPTEAWRTATVEGVAYLGLGDRLVVGTDHVFVAGNRLLALDKRTGDIIWEQPVAGRYIAVYEDTLFHFGLHPDSVRKRLTAYEATTGTRRWRVTALDEGFLPTKTHVLCTGSDGNLTAFHRTDGTQAWRIHRRNLSLLGNDGSIVGWGSSLVKFEPQRRALDVVTDSGSAIAWKRPTPFYEAPVVADGRIVGGVSVSKSVRKRTPTLVALNAATGNRVWGTLWSDHIEEPTGDDDAYAPLSPVVNGTRVFTAINLGEPDRASLYAVELSDGEVRWERSIHGSVTAMGLADGQFLVSTQSSPSDSEARYGKIMGFAAEDGRELWRAEFDSYVQRFAVCDGTIFAVLLDTRVVALE